VGPLGSDRGSAGPTLVVAVAELAPPASSVAVATVPWPRNERGALAGLKTTSYAENVVALAHARAEGAAEAIFADTTGRLCEGTGSNIFVVLDGRALTPSLGSGCLAGVSRALVLEWTDAQEADLPLEVLARADEVFLTSTTREVQPVHAVDGRQLVAPGPVTRRIAEEFTRRAGADPDP
jgi:branched-chain amino acid aminotransferase